MSRNEVIEKYYAQCLQNNLPAAMRALRSAKSQDPKVRSFQKKVKARFQEKTESLNPRCASKLVAAVVKAYRHYYREALQAPKKAKALEAALEERVREIASGIGIKRAGQMKWENLEAALAKEFRRQGYFALFGRVSPYRSLLVWRSQKEKHFKVKIPSEVKAVNIVFLDDFVELGWLHFATFARFYVGGWAKKDALYCVAQAYDHDFSREKFRVSYLVHEAQHFSDFQEFPGLPQADLEYRAKLAELCFLRRPARLLNRIRAEARDDSSLPHSFSAFKILCGLGLPRAPASVRDTARTMLRSHSEELRKLGKEYARGALR